MQAPASASANPSLWRQAALNNVHGLFTVIGGVYQVRGYDVSNMTLIRDASGSAGGAFAGPTLTQTSNASASLAERSFAMNCWILLACSSGAETYA